MKPKSKTEKLTATQKAIIESVKNGAFIYLYDKPLTYRLGKFGKALNWDWMEKMIKDGIFETTNTISPRWNEFTITEKGRRL